MHATITHIETSRLTTQIPLWQDISTLVHHLQFINSPSMTYCVILHSLIVISPIIIIFAEAEEK